VPDSEIAKALRAERAIIARQAENLQAHLKVLNDRLLAIDAALNNAESREPASRVRWGTGAYRRKQIV
jgi:hypothetical protein